MYSLLLNSKGLDTLPEQEQSTPEKHPLRSAAGSGSETGGGQQGHRRRAATPSPPPLELRAGLRAATAAQRPLEGLPIVPA